MNFLFSARPYTAEDKQRAITELLEQAVPDRDFYLLLVGATILAVCGIFLDSIPVLIASMIVAPLALPILALALAVLVGDLRLILHKSAMLLVTILLVAILAAAGGHFFGSVRVDPVLISFGGNLTIATLIAIVSGMIAAYGFMRPKVGGAMTGIGIAVSLLPPLVASALSAVFTDTALVGTTLSIFALNVIGILVGAVTLFGCFGFRAVYWNNKIRT